MAPPTVLVSDDEPLFIRALARTAERFGLSVLADSESEVCALTQQHHPDLVLLDLAQKVDGRLLLSRLKADPKTREVPVIVLTAYGDEHSRELCLGLGAIDVVGKPFDEATFLPRIAQLAGALPAPERRFHARVETDLHCTLASYGTPVEGRVRDLSRGGALVLAPKGLGVVRDTVAIDLEVGGAEAVTLMGEIVRVGVRDHLALYGIRFEGVRKAELEQLSAVIGSVLDGNGVGSRKSPRVYRRIQLACRSLNQFYATMLSISRSGMALKCSVPVAAGDELSIEVLIAGFPTPIVLGGVVKNARPAGDRLYDVGLEFRAPKRPEARVLDELIAFLLGAPRGG